MKPVSLQAKTNDQTFTQEAFEWISQ
jgi:hypothetical protein